MNTVTVTAYPIRNRKTKEIVGWNPVVDEMVFADHFATREEAMEAAKAAVYDPDCDMDIEVL